MKYMLLECLFDICLTLKHLFPGLQIIFTLDEVSFVQNLIFYIETAYRTPVSEHFPLICYVLKVLQLYFIFCAFVSSL